MRKIIPLDRVLIEKAVAEKTRRGGVLLPEFGIYKLNEGKGIALGRGVKLLTVPLFHRQSKQPAPANTVVTMSSSMEKAYSYRGDDLLGLTY